MANNGTIGHETEAINVQDLKAALQKLKTDKIDPKADKTTTVNGHALSSNVIVTKSDVGLGNVTNDAQVKRSEMGASSGVATLNESGMVPSTQLPAYMDDVLELLTMDGTAPASCVKGDLYYNTTSKKIYTATATDTWGSTGSDPEGGKIYANLHNSLIYRWSGTDLIEISKSLSIGITSGTAADGKIVNDHLNDTGNPHSVSKEQVGLGNVVNTGDSATPVSGGATKFTTGGAYTELAKKVDKETGKGLSSNDYTTNEKNKLASAVTSTTNGLKIEVVTEMPASPDVNTIYVVK